MGKPTGFLEYPATRSGPLDRWRFDCATGARSTNPRATTPCRRPGGALHGLRHPVLHAGLSAWAIASRPSTITSTARTGSRPPSSSSTPTTSPSSPADSARRRASRPASWASRTDPVTIERIEYEVAEHAFANGFDVARVTATSATGQRVAVVGSGPAGLAAAAQLASVGHEVHVFERSDAIGGLLRYGIPEFKLEKSVLDRRLAVMATSGVTFHPNCHRRRARAPPSIDLRRDFDAVLLALGSTRPRLIPVPGAQLARRLPRDDLSRGGQSGGARRRAVADRREGPHVIILGGGDTGADCLGTVHRQGAPSVDPDRDPRPAARRASEDQPWPTMARIYKSSPAHDEGGERRFSTETLEFLGGDAVERDHRARRRSTGTRHDASRPRLIAAGFVGPELDDLALASEPS